MVVNQQTIFPDLFSVFYNLVNDYITDPSSRNVQWIFSQFPDEDIAESKLKFPIIIIDPADCSWEMLTVTKKTNMINIKITVYSTSLSQADELLAQINGQIDSRALELKYDDGLDFIELTDTDTGFDRLGGTRIHSRSLSYSMQHDFRSGIGKATKSNNLPSDSEVA